MNHSINFAPKPNHIKQANKLVKKYGTDAQQKAFQKGMNLFVKAMDFTEKPIISRYLSYSGYWLNVALTLKYKLHIGQEQVTS